MLIIIHVRVFGYIYIAAHSRDSLKNNDEDTLSSSYTAKTLVGVKNMKQLLYAPLCLMKSMCTILVLCFIVVLYCFWIQYKN